MAVRTWANSLVIAAGAGLLAGAGQLGVVYGLGIVRWDREFATGAPWHAQLVWLAFLGTVSVIVGALCGAWRAYRLRVAATLALRVGLAVAAGIGAAVMLPLVARPAAAARLAETDNPRVSATLVVAVGLLIGVVAAVAVLAVPPVSGSVIATVLWVWIAGLITAAITLGRGAPWAGAELGLLTGRGVWVPVTLLAPAGLIALGVAGIARFGGADLRAVAVSGLAGPALVGLAYLVAGPGGGTQTQAYRYALFAICAGFAVSAVIAVARRRPVRAPRPIGPAASGPVGPAASGPDEWAASGPVGPAASGPETWTESAAEPATGPVAAEPAEPEEAEPSVTPFAEPARTRVGAADYGWPEPAETEPDASPDSPGVEPTPPPVPAKPRPNRTPSRSRKAAEPAPGPVAPEAATPHEPATGHEPVMRKTEPATRNEPAARKMETRNEEPPSTEEPAGKKPSRLSRRGRRQPDAEPAKPAKPPRGSRAQAREEDHVDWVRSLGGDDGIRVGGTDSARHAKDAEDSDDA